MTSSTTSTVYVNVIEDVINKVREEFGNNGGPGDSVLNELQGIWELKMMQAGAILGPIDRSSASKSTPGGPITPVHDLNVPYEGTEEYETPTAEILFPPTPLQTPMQTPLPGTAQTPLPGTAQTPLPGTAQTPLPGTSDSSMYNIPTGGTPITPNDYPAINENGGVAELKAAGRPNPYMDFFMVPSGKRKREDFASQYHGSGYMPQQDGAGDSMSDDFQVSQRGSTECHNVIAANREVFTRRVMLSSRISQLDGPIPDPYDDVLSTPNIYNYQGGVVNEDYNIVNTPAPHDQAATPAIIPPNDIVDDDDDEPLNENDDDDDLDDVDQGDDLNTQHLVLAQFDKVTRTKSKWKCTLKDGIMHISNKDILFNKATGEFDF
ncbi:transcription initiation factor IIA large subunit-like isoform X2 [Camellia sinensis]|uniref:transcription initiation factor IIA large subunit-like isoform X2 n=1 Tax=Camellia sinensis TaxID=4442 RepID=UPI001035DC84|nr:transcription initiation factor IIA large subunit-like isoform X2 [Camellia sinensis]